MLNTLNEAIRNDVSFRPQDLTADANGIAVDTNGFDDAQVILDVGAVSGTSPTLDTKFQESADGSGGWTDISGATIAQITAADQHKTLGINLRSVKRYIRAVATITGTSPTFQISVSINLGTTDKYPVSQP